MKRRDLERHLREHGVRLLREGGNHSFWGFRFVVLIHKYMHDARGKVSVWGRGGMTLEAGVGKTGSVAATVKRLHSTPRIEARQITRSFPVFLKFANRMLANMAFPR